MPLTELKSQRHTPERGQRLLGLNLSPPNLRSRLRESRTLPLVASNVWRWGQKFPDINGEGKPVILIPGFQAGENTMEPLRAFLERHNFSAVHWGLGRNLGDVPDLAPQVTQKIQAFAALTRRPVALVGWSLGGYLARESARDLPKQVSQVITFGTPAWGGPKYTVAGRLYEKQGLDLIEVENGIFARFDRPIQQPITAFFNKNDGIVNWHCCIDHWSPNVKHIEIPEPHLGMAFSARLFREVANKLISQSQTAEKLESQ